MRRATPFPVLMLLAALLGCTASGGPQPSTEPLPIADNSRTSLDWEGVYSGTVPCADCAGVRTRIELRAEAVTRAR